MKKTNCLLAFILFHIINTFGQSPISTKFSDSPKYLWAKCAGGTDEDIANSVITDLNGNVIIAGTFQSPTITFDTITLINSSQNNIFLAKYNASGNVLWAKNAGGTNWYHEAGVSTDKIGNIFITGTLLIAKYDPLGNILWTKDVGGEGQSVAADSNNNVVVAGYITLGAYNSDIFINKYDPSGNILWTKNIGGTGRKWANGISLDKDGNIVVAGGYTKTVTIGSTTLTNSTPGGFYSDIVVLKFDSLGNFIWAKTSTGSDGSDEATSVATDSNGNVIVTGSFSCSYLNFGTATFLANINEDDVFIVKYDPNGNELWAKCAGGRYQDYGQSISCDASGNAVIAGYFKSESIIFETDTLTNKGTPTGDIFIAKYNSDGNFVWAKSAGGSQEDRANSVFVDANGNIIIAGQFGSSPATFGTNILDHIHGSGTSDVFIAKLDFKGGLDVSFDHSDWAIYPNPSNGIFHIANRTSNVSNLEIYNVLGEKIYSLELNSNNVEIDFNKMPKGLYFITLTADNQRTIQKLVINH